MSPIAIITLVNAIMDIGMRLLKEYQAPEDTPEEQKAELKVLRSQLVKTADAVAAYKPLEH